MNYNLSNDWCRITDGYDLAKPGKHTIYFSYYAGHRADYSLEYQHEDLYDSDSQGSLTLIVHFRCATPYSHAQGTCEFNVRMEEIVEHAAMGQREKGERWFEEAPTSINPRLLQPCMIAGS
jgi:hypothetical protein